MEDCRGGARVEKITSKRSCEIKGECSAVLPLFLGFTNAFASYYSITLRRELKFDFRRSELRKRC